MTAANQWFAFTAGGVHVIHGRTLSPRLTEDEDCKMDHEDDGGDGLHARGDDDGESGGGDDDDDDRDKKPSEFSAFLIS